MSAIEIIGLVLGSNWVGNFLIEIYKNRRKKKTPMEKMVLSLGRSELLREAKKVQRVKCFQNIADYEALVSLGNSYIEMGGNSAIKKIYEEVKEYPIKESGEVK